jgi:hypothetical protein
MAADDLRRGILIGLGFATVHQDVKPSEMFHKLHMAWGFPHEELTTHDLRTEIAMILHDDERTH